MTAAGKVQLCGIGDDGVEGMTAHARRLVEEAELLVGPDSCRSLLPTVLRGRLETAGSLEELVERIEAAPWTVTVEENALQTGFGSAVLEAVCDARAATESAPPLGPIVRLGLPDRFVEHGERGDLLADLGLDAAGIAATCRRLAARDTAVVPVRRG